MTFRFTINLQVIISIKFKKQYTLFYFDIQTVVYGTRNGVYVIKRMYLKQVFGFFTYFISQRENV